MKYKTNDYCRNCHFPLPYKAGFCAHCGQKAFKGKVKMKALLQRLWQTTFHLDNKFLTGFLRLLTRPGKATADFFEGKQKRYPNPLQFFAVGVFCLLVMAGKEMSQGTAFSGAELSVRENDQWVKLGDIFDALERDRAYKDMRQAADSLPATLRVRLSPADIDTLWSVANRRWNEAFYRHIRGDSAGPIALDSVPMRYFNFKQSFAVADILALEPDSIVQKYKVSPWYKAILFKQGIKNMQDPQGTMRFFTANLAWVFLLVTVWMAWVLQLMYRRRDRYYAEHFVFMLHHHAAMLVIVFVFRSLVVLLRWAGIYTKGALGIVTLAAIFLHLYLAMRRFYGQGWIKMSLKYLIFAGVYFISAILLFVLSLLVAYILF